MAGAEELTPAEVTELATDIAGPAPTTDPDGIDALVVDLGIGDANEDEDGEDEQ